MKALIELYRANLTEFLSNRRALFLTIAFPVFFIVIFGLVFSNQDKQKAKIGLVVEDSGLLGTEIGKALEKLPSYDAKAALNPTTKNVSEENQAAVDEQLDELAGPASSPADSSAPSPSPTSIPTAKPELIPAKNNENPFSAMQFIRGDLKSLMQNLSEGKVDAVIVVPKDTTDIVSQGKTAPIELHIDSSRQTLIPFLRGGIGAVLNEINQHITDQPELLTLHTVPTKSRDLRIIDYLLPGILAMSIMQLGLFATAQPLIALRVSGVLKQLSATPLKRSTLLVAYIGLRLTVALLQTLLIIAIGVWLFKVAIVGNWALLAAWLFLGTLTFLAIGFFLASVAKNEESAIAAANVVNIPMLLLSGVFFPISQLPPFMNAIIAINPLNYLADALRQIMVEAQPQHTMTTNAIALGIWTIVMTILAIQFFRWEKSS